MTGCFVIVFTVFMAKRARRAAARRMNTLKFPLSVRPSDCVLLSLTLLLLRCGDIESNPGPGMEDLIKDLGNRLSKQISDVSNEMKSMSSKMESIQEQFHRQQKDFNSVRETTEKLESRAETIEERLEKQDIMMRRDNIIVYGLDEGGGDGAKMETEEQLLDSLVTVLNKHDSSRQWSEDDFASVLRLGKPEVSKKRPVVARLIKSRVKRAVISNKHLRQALKTKNMKIDDDLTEQQRQTLKHWRDEGFIAFYRGVRLYTKKRSESRHAVTRSDCDEHDHNEYVSQVDLRRSSPVRRSSLRMSLRQSAETARRRRSADAATSSYTSSHPHETRRYSHVDGVTVADILACRGGGPTDTSSSAAKSSIPAAVPVAASGAVTPCAGDEAPSPSASAAAAQQSGHLPASSTKSRSSDTANLGGGTRGSAPGKPTKQSGAGIAKGRRGSPMARPQSQGQTSPRTTRTRAAHQSTLDSGWGRSGNGR